MTINWQPNPGPQTEFTKRREFEVLYGGAARGGKSDALLAEAARYIDYPDYRAILFRRTYPQLSQGGGLIDRSRVMYGGIGEYFSTARKWVFPSGAEIQFGHLDRDADVYNYQGGAYESISFDEATHFTEFQIRYMYSRCISNSPYYPARIRYASNPGNVGHLFFKERFVNNGAYNSVLDPVSGHHRVYIPARVYDNPYYNPDSEKCVDPNYIYTLMMLPEDQRRMLLEGDWDIFTGQFFNEWRESLHVVKPFSIPDGWLMGFGIDYGLHDPFCWLEGALDLRESPTLYITNEYYAAEVTPQENAREVVRRLKGRNYEVRCIGKDVKRRVPQLHEEEDESEVQILDLLRVGGLEDLQLANDNRVQGWAAIAQLLHWEGHVERPTLLPRLKVFNNCKNLIRTLPTLIKDDKHPEDIDRNAEDHAADALRYLVMSFYRYFEGKDRQRNIILKRKQVTYLRPQTIERGYLI